MIESLYDLFLTNPEVSTDTRSISKGCIFFALKGPNFNGNLFAKNAIDAGASYAVIDEEPYIRSDQYILVEDVLSTLQDLAKHHRQQMNIPVLAITGSNGKTTTKELIQRVLATKYNTLATLGNLNNHIGVPRTLLKLNSDHEVAIIELGANKLGDITELCEIVEPTHGLITNIGKAHIEGFGSFEGVIRGKSELYQYLIEHKGEVFINSQNEILSNMAKRFDHPFFYPADGDYFHCEFIDANPYVRYSHDSQLRETKLIGSYNFENVAAALCIARYFDIDLNEADHIIENYAPENNRSQVISKGSNTIIMDAYNANPSSMKAAIDNLKSMNVEKKSVILGDMGELGTESDNEHYKIGLQLTGAEFDQVIFCGQHMEQANEACSEAYYFETFEDIIEHLKEKPIENNTVLVKASRSMGLEKIIEYL